MLSTLAIDPVPTKQQIADYVNAATRVTMYSNAVVNAKLPPLSQPPSTYGQFATQFGIVKGHVLEWPNSVIPQMVALPTTVSNFNSLFQAEAANVQGYLSLLIGSPDDKTYRDKLAASLQPIIQQVQSQVKAFDGLKKTHDDFASQLKTDLPVLDGLAKDALKFVGEDQGTILTIQGQIHTLQNSINSMNTWLTVSEIGMGLSIFVGLIGVVCLFVPGGQGIGVGLIGAGVVGEGASIAGTVILNKEINAANALIQDKRKTITAIGQDINLLHQLNVQIQSLETQNQAAQKAMVDVTSFWAGLESDLTTLSNDLKSTSTDATADDFKQAATDMDNAVAAWNDVNAWANAVKSITYTVDPLSKDHVLSAHQD